MKIKYLLTCFKNYINYLYNNNDRDNYVIITIELINIQASYTREKKDSWKLQKAT